MAMSAAAPSCDRAYVVGDYDCPEQIGNRIFVVLNAQLCAATFDTPLVWRRTPGNMSIRLGCDRFLARKPLLTRADALLERCPKMTETAYLPYAARNTPQMDAQERHLRDRPLQPKPGELTHCGQLNRPQFHHVLKNPGLLPPQRTALQSRFDGGLLRAYGEAFNQLFEFTPEVMKLAHSVLHSGGPLLGVHVRHLPAHRLSWAVLENTTVAAVLKAAEELSADGRCRIAIASEESASVERLSAAVAHKCHVVTIPRRSDDALNPFASDHGAYSGITFMAELYLLSLCTVVFAVGGSSSAELVLALTLQHRGHQAFLCHVDATCSNVTSTPYIPYHFRFTPTLTAGGPPECGNCVWVSFSRCSRHPPWSNRSAVRCYAACCTPERPSQPQPLGNLSFVRVIKA